MLVASAVSAVVAGPALGYAGPAPDPVFQAEKCYGVNAVGKNDCSTRGSSCAGEAKTARDDNSWIYVPRGTCEKIEGGSIAPKKAGARRSPPLG
ncbi:MAG: DUF2282 domain-containing protein [Stellaceae bacterium]